ncbi:hypothetical protein AB988_2935 [Acinetobacter baumannii]|nr:hypothetical protein J606_3669 [Acinetobacter baumannii 318814]KMV08882.1 hypothetical protein AB994_3960 [Acinetobacter baumannii]KMV10562.1 hypothetical protein AB988_2935 [Acinetobacter baumannii]
MSHQIAVLLKNLPFATLLARYPSLTLLNSTFKQILSTFISI